MEKYIIPLIYSFLLLIIILITPYSGLGEAVQLTWNDQNIFLQSLQEALSGTTPIFITKGLVGSGYIALGVIATKLLGTQPIYSLVALNRFCFISTVLFFFMISHFLLKKTLINTETILNVNIHKNKINYFSCTIAFIYTIVLLLSSNFVAFSDIPWTHFISTFLILVCLLSLFYFVEKYQNYKRSQYIWISLFGFSLGLLIQVRFFEGAIFILSTAVWLILLLFKNRNISVPKILIILKSLAVTVISFLIALYLSLILTNSKEFHMLYFTYAKHDPAIKEATKLYLSDFPLKLVQLFLDTNFFNRNQSYTIQPIIWGFNLNTWKMPLLLQIPALIYIIPCTILIIFLVLIQKDSFLFLSAEFFLPLLIGSGLILGYVSSAASGSPLLKYGFIRDFMASTWCLALITGPWLFYRYIILFPLYFRKWLGVMLLGLQILICIIYGQFLIRSISFFQFQDFHVKAVQLKHNCSGLECSVSVKMYNPKGQVIKPFQERNIVTAVCPSTGENVAVTLSSQNQIFTLKSCPESYPVNVSPVSMGFTGPLEPPASWVFKPDN